jgi:hypothetical protein
MARQEQPPFGRGETGFSIGGSPASTDLKQWEGKEWVFEDIDWSGTHQSRSNKYVRCRLVRNVSTVSLRPKALVSFKTTDATTYGSQVDGYAVSDGVAVGSIPGFPVDEFLPSNVAINDIFWIVMEGPAMVVTTLDNSATVNINVGDLVGVATTAAGTTGTTGGRVEALSALTGAAAATQTQNLKMYHNALGRALTAATTAQTNTSILVEVCRW